MEDIKNKNFSLNEKLKALDSKELYALVKALINKNSEAHRLALEWLKKKAEISKESSKEKEVVFLNDELLMEYWKNTKKIISKCNEYDDWPEKEESKANTWLRKISELIEEGNISYGAKCNFLDSAFADCDIGNSGFEDTFMSIFFNICETKAEWEYLLKKLEERPSDWGKNLIIGIKKNYLCDEEAYLKERMRNLRWGAEYWDLIDFYVKRGNLQKALETAEQGILKGEGSLTELFQFLFEHFSKNKDLANLKRIVNTALTRRTEAKVMLDRLFEYYKALDDYENAKEVLLKAYEFAGYLRCYEEYKKIKEFLKESDWKKVEPEILEKARGKNLLDYMRICMEKNMKKSVLDIILDPPRNRLGFSIKEHIDEFTDKLKEDFPEKIIDYYWERAYQIIKLADTRTSYHYAARNLDKAKHIYIEVLKDEPGWKKRFSGLKEEFKKRSAFLDEVKDL